MSEYGDCNKCGEFSVSSLRHVCQPKYLVWRPDAGETEDDADTFSARSHCDAAERWAEKDDRNSADYTIVGGSSAEVLVRLEGEEVSRWVSVSGETVASYHGREIVKP